jgi:hypothetical protein
MNWLSCAARRGHHQFIIFLPSALVGDGAVEINCSALSTGLVRGTAAVWGRKPASAGTDLTVVTFGDTIKGTSLSREF